VSSLGSYNIIKTIGQGKFGKVKLCEHVLTGQRVAIKVVDKVYSADLVREIETWRKLNHPNICRLYDVLCTETKIYMVSEYCSGGEAFTYILKNGPFDHNSQLCKRIFRQIVLATDYCHQNGMVHRDIKLENIVFTSEMDVKLIDFGFSRTNENALLLDTFCGSLGYSAPELVTGRKYSGTEIDVWSLGVILYILVTGNLPFDDDNDKILKEKIARVEYTIPDWLSSECVYLIEGILQQVPSERLSISEILDSEWVRGYNEPVKRDFEFGTTKKELNLVVKLVSLGLNVESILESVYSKKCNQMTAMWYLLLEKEESHEADIETAKRVIESVMSKSLNSENPILEMSAKFESATDLSHDTDGDVKVDSRPIPQVAQVIVRRAKTASTTRPKPILEEWE
jgi:serine/threonine protein kinase